MPRSLTLAIETSNPGHGAAASVTGALLADADSSVLGIAPLAPASRHDDALMPAIEGLCRTCDATPAMIDRVVVSIGPGGYTSIRIAVTTAKMIATATGASCVGVPTALAVAMQHWTDDQDARPRTVYLAWKRGDVYRTHYASRADLTDTTAGEITPIDALRLEPGSIVLADSAFLDVIRDQGDLPSDVCLEEAVLHPEAVLHAAAACATTDPLSLLPLYPREPEAVSKWKTRPGASG